MYFKWQNKQCYKEYATNCLAWILGGGFKVKSVWAKSARMCFCVIVQGLPLRSGTVSLRRIRWHWEWHGWWGRWHRSFPGSSSLLSIMMFRAMCSPVPKICSIPFVEVSWGCHHEGKWNLDCLQPLEVRQGEEMGREDQWSDGKQGKRTN